MTARRSFLLGLGAAGVYAGTRGVRAASGAPGVVASFSILADMTRAVAGDGANVTSLVGPGTDAHVFTPSPSDARRVAEAGLVVVNGLYFEGWMQRLVMAAGYRGPVIVATRSIQPRMRGRAPDPHAWQSLRKARVYVENIALALAALPGADREVIAQRARAYTDEIAQLDRECAAAFAAIPAHRRRVLTAHDAFGYLGQDYDVEFLAPRGWSTDSEPSAAAVAGLVHQIRDQRVRAVFLENVSNQKLVQELAREGRIAIGGTLYSDALSPPGTEADTYLRMYRHNVTALVAALR